MGQQHGKEGPMSLADQERGRIDSSAPDAIEATLDYLLDSGVMPSTTTARAGEKDVRTGTADPRRLRIGNGRRDADGFELDREGFRFVRHDTKVADFFDAAQVRGVYYPEMEALVRAETGAARVVVFDHTLRTADDDDRAARQI